MDPVILLIVIVRGGFGICFIGRLTQAQSLSSYQYHSGLATVRSVLISPLAVSIAHVRTAGGERSWHTTLIAAWRARYGTAELSLAIANLCVV